LKIPSLRKFVSLPVMERRILLKAFFLLWCIRLGMWMMPFRMIQQIYGRFFPIPVTATGQVPSKETILMAKKMGWAVRSVSGMVPSATCLARALTLQALLSRKGIPSSLALGVAQGNESGIIAHAWVEVDGIVIIGGEERDRFTRLKRPV
jgi:hypothetical protein